jgi:hypothetical protein
MANYKTQGLSGPQTQFTQVTAYRKPDESREKMVDAVVKSADMAGRAYAKSEGAKMTGADSSLAEINQQADTIDKSIDKALSVNMTDVAGPLQERDINEIKDRELSRFATDDRTLRELRDRGTISTVEARARRQLNLRRSLSNPINAMFKKDFLNASGDMTGGGAGAAAALFPYTAEEETAMAIAEEQRKVQAEHEAKVFDVVQKTGQDEAFVRNQFAKEEIARQDLANFEAIKTQRELNAEESAQYQTAMEGSATRGMTLHVSTLMAQSGGKGLDAVSMANSTRTLEYQYNGMLQAINANTSTSAAHRDKAIERLDKWKTGMETFIKAHSLTDYNTALVDGLKSDAVVANWETMPQLMALASVNPELANVYIKSAGMIDKKMEVMMGPEKYNAWKAKIGGDVTGQMGTFASGGTASPETIGMFQTPDGIEYLSKQAKENPSVRANMLKAYNDATDVSLSSMNSIEAAQYSQKNEDYRGQIGEAMDVARTKVNNIKKLVGDEGAVIYASHGEKSFGDSFYGRKTGVVLDLPDNMVEYQNDVIEMFRTVDRHPWAWKHVEEQYVDSADAFNGYLRGEWEFDPTMGDGVPTAGGMREAPEPTKEQLAAEGRIAPESVIDKGTPLPAPKEGNLGSLLAGLEAGNEEDEAKLAEILEQRKAIRDRERSSSGVRQPGAMAVAEAQAKAPDDMVNRAETPATKGESEFQAVKDMIAGIETAHGAKSDKAYAQPPNKSGYEGKYQFRYRSEKDAGWDIALQLGIDPKAPKTPEQQEAIMDEYLNRNAKRLKARGHPVTPYNLWLMHNQGPGGANAILSGKLTDTIRRNIKNQGVKGETDEELISNYHKKFKGKMT